MFANKSHEFLYYKKREGKVPKRSLTKMIKVMDSKCSLDVMDFSKKGEKIAGPRDVLNDFLECTSVHGLQYFGKTDVKVGIGGKILWTCTILTGFVCVSLMVMQFLHRYNDNPTITYVNSFFAPIFKAPFPAVTICPLSPIPLHRRLNIIENIVLPKNTSRRNVMEILKYAHHLTRPYGIKQYNELEELRMLLEANDWKLIDFLKILRPCEDVMESCWWSNERIDCSTYFKTSHTSFGLCCSFNYLLEEFVERDKRQPRPKLLHSVAFGRTSGLQIRIKKEILEIDTDAESELSKRITNSDSLLVLIHNSLDYPGLNTNYRILQKDIELEIGVVPVLYKKSVDLYHHNEEHDSVPLCIPDTENILEYFPIYRYPNCYANCRVRAMIDICGCIPFIFDYIAEYHNVNPCKIDGLQCIQEHAKEIGIVRDTVRENFTCVCKPPCENVIYNDYPNVIALTSKKTSSNYANMSGDNAVLRVFMSSQIFQILETIPAADEIYLLASIGGIFSLFLGCSFLSLVEIVYFICLLCRATFRRRKIDASPQKIRVRRKDSVDDKLYPR